MTNKLVVIINSLKVPNIKKILLYEMEFLVPIYSCLQNPWLGGYVPRSPFSLSSVLNWICWTPSPRKKIPGYATEWKKIERGLKLFILYLIIVFWQRHINEFGFCVREINTSAFPRPVACQHLRSHIRLHLDISHTHTSHVFELRMLIP